MIAYLDANSGSLIVSAIAAGAAGIAVVAKTGWRRIAALFSSSKRAELKAEKEAAEAARAKAEARAQSSATGTDE